jgi:hypothetical protein
MKICRIFVLLTAFTSCLAQQDLPQAAVLRPRIAHLVTDPQSVTALHLRPGFVTSVRLPEDVSSVVLGNPAAFKAEHSDAEPRLVFLKPTGLAPSESNALITTKGGHEISLQLVSSGDSHREGVVDFVLEFTKPRSFLLDASQSSFVVAETRSFSSDSLARAVADGLAATNQQLLMTQQADQHPHWRGQTLRAAVGHITENGQQMAVAFSVLNDSARTIELLPPQLQLAGSSRGRHGKPVKADQIPVKDYLMTVRRLAAHTRADGVVTFERPAFKESNERILLQLAQAAEVDRPVFVPIPFVSPLEGGTR